jgi:hypothetical protein
MRMNTRGGFSCSHDVCIEKNAEYSQFLAVSNGIFCCGGFLKVYNQNRYVNCIHVVQSNVLLVGDFIPG